jgi:methionine synthase / methylenetetrahydrofolate reductase (NADH)
MAKVPFLDALSERILVGDSAMGSRLYELGASLNVSYDYLNIVQPELVRQVHRENLEAGADLIETNTFSANRYKLGRFGLEGQVAEINRRGVQIARDEVARAARAGASGNPAYVAGAVGPLPGGLTDVSIEELPEADARAAFREQITALAEAGVDLILLETFTELSQIKLALDEAKKACALPIIAQMTFPDGLYAPDGSDAFTALEELHRLGADVVGTNCGQGVAKVLKSIEYLGQRTNARLSAFANAGLPQRVGGRLLYLATPEYIAESAQHMVEAGANLVGGCCGTTARDIAQIAARVRSMKPAPRQISVILREQQQQAPTLPPRPVPDFLAHLKAKPVVLVELDAPKNADIQKFIRGVKQLQQAGADAITIGDSPLATMRMNGFMLAALAAKECDIDIICHLACRDRNQIATQGLLLGAEALGIRNLLAITGDPAKLGDYPDATSVYDFNSFKLIELIAKLNSGTSLSGQPLGRPTSFTTGVAYNPNVRNIDVEAKRLARKVERGGQFALTQAVFDSATLKRAVDAAKPLGIPIFAGVYPLVSHRNAEYLHNEFPGMTICQEVRDRMAAAAPDKAQMAAEGMKIAKELIDEFLSIADGIYIIPPFNRASAAVELLQYIHARTLELRR